MSMVALDTIAYLYERGLGVTNHTEQDWHRQALANETASSLFHVGGASDVCARGAAHEGKTKAVTGSQGVLGSCRVRKGIGLDSELRLWVANSAKHRRCGAMSSLFCHTVGIE